MSYNTPRLETVSKQCSSLLIMVLFCLIILTACVIGTAGAEGIDIDYGTKDVSSDSWSYVDGTLTLSGGTWDYISVTGIDLMLVLNGVNTISGGNQVIEGSNAVYYGIYVENGGLTIRDGDDKGVGSLMVGEVTASGIDSSAYGIRADDITVSGGAVTVHADAVNGDAYGISVDFGGVFTITAGEVKANAEVTGELVYAYGVDADEIEITGGKITAIGDNWAFTPSYISDILTASPAHTVLASENVDGTELSAVSSSAVTEVGSEYRYVVIAPSQPGVISDENSSRPLESPMPILAVLAGFGAAVLLRRR